MNKPDVLFQKSDYSLCNNKNIILLKSEYIVLWIIKRLVFKEEEYSLFIDIY